MIQIYSPQNTDFNNNGNIVLFPTECTMTANLNADWVLSLKHIIDEQGRWKFIVDGAVIKAPSFNDDQLFRIYNVELNETEIIAMAYPIFLDACNDTFLLDVRPTLVNGQTALNQILKGTKYTGSSNIIKTATAYYQNQNAISAINGDIDQSFINRWGGQIIYDNFNIIINQQAGGDYGVTLRYGKNILGMTQKIDRSNLCTRIVPQAYNGYMLTGNEPWVDSPLINNYPVAYTRVVKFEDVKLTQDAQDDEESFPTLAALRQELVRKSKLMFSEENIDKEEITLDIDVELLENVSEYSSFAQLEKISLGDTAVCLNEKLGISVKTQAISITYDCIKEKTQSVILGSFQPNYFTNNTLSVEKATTDIKNTENLVNNNLELIRQITNSDGTINAEKVQGILNAVNVQLKSQITASEKQNIRAVLFEDLDPASELYGALSIGTLGIQIAKTRTPDGRDWEWKTAITANGVVSDELVGQYIRGIAIEADKGNIAGFEITDTGMKKTWDVKEPNGQTYKIICEISSETGSSTQNYIIKIYSTVGSEYILAISDDGNIECNEVRCESIINRSTISSPRINVNMDNTSDMYGYNSTPFAVRACNGGLSSERWRQLRWYINNSNAGVLQPLDQNGTENSTCDLGGPSHKWSRIYLDNSPIVTSDPNKKKNQKLLDFSVLDFIKAIQPYSYNLKHEGNTAPIRFGFMAPDIDSAAKKTIGNIAACSYDNEAGWSLSYEEFIAPLTYAVKYLLNKIENLEEELKNASYSKSNA